MNHLRSSHGCAFVPSTEKGEDQVVVVGGIKSDSTVESLSTNSKQWMLKEGWELLVSGNAVTNSNSPNYLLYFVGGYNSGEIDKIYGFSHSNSWDYVARLTKTRAWHSSLSLGRTDIPGCS